MEKFNTNQNLNLKGFNLITIRVDKQDFRVDLNNKLDVMFCNQQSSSSQVSQQTVEIHILNQDKVNIFDIFHSSISSINFTDYYTKSSELLKTQGVDKLIPFKNYVSHEQFLKTLSREQGTNRQFYNQTLDYRIEEKSSPKIEGGFVYEKFIDIQRMKVFDFDNKQSKVYPEHTLSSQKKNIFLEIKALMQQYFFIQKSLVLLSPPLNGNNNDLLNFLPCQRTMKQDQY